MKQKIALLWIAIIVLAVFCGCSKGELYSEQNPELAPIVADYYDEIGISKKDYQNAEAVYKTFQIREGKDLTFRFPEYWQEVYSLGFGENSISVSERYSVFKSLPLDGGYLWGIHLYSHKYYAEYFLDDFHMVCLEQIGYNAEIIGADDDYVYLLSIPSDVQYDSSDELAAALYDAVWQTKDKFVSDFLAVNEIRPIVGTV